MMTARLIQDVRPRSSDQPAVSPKTAAPQLAERMRAAPTAAQRALPHLQPYALPPRQPTVVAPVRPVAPPVVRPDIRLKPAPKPVARPAPAPSPSPAATPGTGTRRQARTPRRSWWARLGEAVQYPLIAVGALVAANNTSIGQWLVLAYAVFAIIRGLRSQVSFGTALFLLIAIPIFQLLKQPGVAQNLAIYVYELLVVGTLQAVIELYKTRHKAKPKA